MLPGKFSRRIRHWTLHAESQLQSRLEDILFQLRASHGDDAFPRGAGEYLNDWADNDKGWLDSLTQRQFVGTKSRLRTVFDLL